MLFRKMLRDMKWNKMQFISIFLLAFFGVYVYACVGGETVGVKQIREKFNAESNLGDAWVYGDNFSKDELALVKKINGVDQAERRLYLTAVGEGEKKPVINMYFQDENLISMPKVVEGEKYDTSKKENVWIDRRLADAYSLSIGDYYTFDINGIDLTLKIAGFVYSPGYTYYMSDDAMMPDFSKIGIAFASHKAIEDNEQLSAMFMQAYGMIPYSQLVIKMDSENSSFEDDDRSSDNASLLEEKVEKALGGEYSYYLTRKDIAGVYQLNDEMVQHESMMIIFSVAFVAIAILAITTTMNRLVSNQRTQIGTMKALGLKKRRIVGHYVFYGFFLSAIGASLGVLLGPVSLPKLFIPSMSTGYTLPEWHGGYSISFWIVAVLTAMACTLTTYFSCKKVLSVNPAETLRPAAPKAGKSTIFEKLPFWNRLGFGTQYNLRDISRSKIRCLMGFAGTLCCMALLVCSASMYDSFNGMSAWLYDDINNYDNQVMLTSESKLEEADDLTDKLDGESVMEDAVIVRYKGQKHTIQFSAAQGKGMYRVTDSNMNIKVLKGNDFAITQKIAKTMGVSIGDEIEWHLINDEEWITSKITIINRMPMGSGITTTRSFMDNNGVKFKPSYIGTNKAKNKISGDCVKKVFTAEDMKEGWDRSMEAMTIIIVILIVVAILLALLILYNLGLLAYAEREREMATLKVVGFNSAKLRRMLLMQNTWLSMAGIIAGTPAGILLVQYMIDIMGDNFDMTATLSLSSFLLCSAGTLLVSIIVSLMFSGRIKKLDMVASLKGVD